MMIDPAVQSSVAPQVTFPKLRPKDAATLILIDRTSGTPKLLMGRRHDGHAFMPGKFVFPGGRMEARDRYVPVGGELDAAVERGLMRRLARPSRAKARAMAVAAIREVFEETGLLLGRKHSGPLHIPGLWAAFAEAGVEPDLSALHFVARAITPPGRPRRFDTRFFAADAAAIAHKIEGVVGPEAELVELVWVPIAEARALDVPSITQVVLRDLEARIAAGFSRELPVPYYRTIHRRYICELL
jgi:8-oxo-dGTP pyrophosphatase MutT (NUDIX family)